MVARRLPRRAGPCYGWLLWRALQPPLRLLECRRVQAERRSLLGGFADFDIDVSSDRRMRGLAANQYVFAFKVAALNYKRIADYARDQLRKADRAERRAIITPIRPDVKVTGPNSNNISTTPVREPKKANPAEKKVRSRDRNGWSNYRRNAKKVPTVGTPPKP